MGYAASKTRRGLPGIVFSNSWRDVPGNNLSFTLAGVSWHGAQDLWLPTIFSDEEEF